MRMPAGGANAEAPATRTRPATLTRVARMARWLAKKAQVSMSFCSNPANLEGLPVDFRGQLPLRDGSQSRHVDLAENRPCTDFIGRNPHELMSRGQTPSNLRQLEKFGRGQRARKGGPVPDGDHWRRASTALRGG